MNNTDNTPLIRITRGMRLTDYSTVDVTVADFASGGMGLVAWGPRTGANDDWRALKMVRPDKANPKSAAAFAEEALIWCHLWPHPYIIVATGLTQLPALNNLPVLQLEYARQGSLRAWLTRAKASPTQVLTLRVTFAWAQQIAAALVAIHTPDFQHERKHPLVHCDLKPENVLIAGNNTAQLTDLGLARAWAKGDGSNAGVGTGDGAGPASTPGNGGGHRAHLEPAATAGVDLSALETVRLTPEELTARMRQARIARMAEALQRAQVQVQAQVQTHGAGTDDVQAAEALLLTRSRRLPPLPTIQAMGTRGAVVGTPPYMPPEQWLGIDAVVPASDLYAFGVLLFELFSGTAGLASYPHIPEQPGLEGWYAAHRVGPARRLSAPEVHALDHGPLAALFQAQAQAETARSVLAGLDQLIVACLNPQAALRPTAQAALATLGELAVRAGQERLVVAEVPQTPKNEAAFWTNLAITAGNLGQHAEKLRLTRRAIDATPDNPELWTNAGNAAVKLGDERRKAGQEAEARAHYEEALALHREAERRITPAMIAEHATISYALYHNLGNALGRLRRYEEAVAAYETCLAHNPDQPDTRYGLAVGYWNWADEADADPEERLRRLRAAQQYNEQARAAMPEYEQAQRLARAIAAALRQVERELQEQQAHHNQHN